MTCRHVLFSIPVVSSPDASREPSSRALETGSDAATKGSAELQFCEKWSRARTTGFDGIELYFPDASMSHGTTGAIESPSSMADVVARCWRTLADLPIRALRIPCPDTDPAGAVAHVSGLLPLLIDCAPATLSVALRPIFTPDGSGFGSYQSAVNFAYKFLHQVRHEAESSGVAVGLEAGTGGALLSPVELRELIDAANSWAVGACLPVRAVERIGQPVDWIETLRHRIHAVRMFGGPTADVTDTPGHETREKLEALAAALDSVAYTGAVIVGPYADDSLAQLAANMLWPERKRRDADGLREPTAGS